MLSAERSEQQVFDELEALCGSTGYIHTLAFLSFRDNFIVYDDKLTNDDVADSYAPKRLLRTEFATLVGLMIKHVVDFSLPSPSEIQRQIELTESLLSDLHNCLNKPMFETIKRVIQATQEGEPKEYEKAFRRGDVLREPIFYGGESAYSFQYRDLMLKRYAEDGDWLQEKKGFRITDAHAVASA